MVSQKRSLRILVSLMFVCSLVNFVSCGGRSESDGKIRLCLNWFPDAQHGGFYAALVNGHYEAEGLDVEIQPGGPSANVLEKVQLGRAEFGVSNADQILLKRNQGQTLVALLAPMQNSPRCIMVHEESGIESFEDLNGITLALGPGRPFAEFMKLHAPLENVRIVNYSGSITRFLTDTQFAQQGYVITEPLLAERQGANPSVLMLSDLGFNPYTSCLFAEESFLKENPSIAEKFVRATLKGWMDYLEDPEPINERILAESPELDKESLDYAVEVMRPLCLPDGMSTNEVGAMTEERWNQLVDQLRQIGDVDDDFTSEGAYRVDLMESARSELE